jgi:hypothetical protein
MPRTTRAYRKKNRSNTRRSRKVQKGGGLPRIPLALLPGVTDAKSFVENTQIIWNEAHGSIIGGRYFVVPSNMFLCFTAPAGELGYLPVFFRRILGLEEKKGLPWQELMYQLLIQGPSEYTLSEKAKRALGFTTPGRVTPAKEILYKTHPQYNTTSEIKRYMYFPGDLVQDEYLTFQSTNMIYGRYNAPWGIYDLPIPTGTFLDSLVPFSGITNRTGWPTVLRILLSYDVINAESLEPFFDAETIDKLRKGDTATEDINMYPISIELSEVQQHHEKFVRRYDFQYPFKENFPLDGAPPAPPQNSPDYTRWSEIRYKSICEALGKFIDRKVLEAIVPFTPLPINPEIDIKLSEVIRTLKSNQHKPYTVVFSGACRDPGLPNSTPKEIVKEAKGRARRLSIATHYDECQMSFREPLNFLEIFALVRQIRAAPPPMPEGFQESFERMLVILEELQTTLNISEYRLEQLSLFANDRQPEFPQLVKRLQTALRQRLGILFSGQRLGNGSAKVAEGEGGASGGASRNEESY